MTITVPSKLLYASGAPSTVTSESPGDVAWLNPGNASTQDNTPTTCTLAIGQTSEYLTCTAFGIDVPADASIVGMQTLIVAKPLVTPTIKPLPIFTEVSVVKDGAIVSGTDQTTGDEQLNLFTYSVFRFGGEYNRWGTTLTQADVEKSTFGIAIKVEKFAAPSERFDIDYVQLVIFYTHSIRQAFQTYLNAAGMITALVGSNIYQGFAPSSTGVPYLVWTVIDSIPIHHQGGSSGTTQTRIQVDCYDVSGAQLDYLAQAVRMELDHFRGLIGSTFVNNTVLESRVDGLEGPSDGSQRRTLRSTMDFLIMHDESIPNV